MKRSILSVAILIAMLSACGSDDSSSSGSSSAYQGQFIDSAVANIDYQTESMTGVTDENGFYNYNQGETVTFSIGSIQFPPVLASSVVTPLNMANSNDVNDDQVVNIIRLLQSLDSDGDSENGITISPVIKSLATQPIDFDVEPEVFEDNTEVTALLSAQGYEMVSIDEAIEHFSQALSEEGITYGKFVGTWAISEEGSDNRDYTLLMFTFFDDGTYIHYEIVSPEDQDDEGFSGAEWGKYRVSDDSYLVRVGEAVHDSNGNFGLGDLIAPDEMDYVIPSDFDGETVQFSFNDDESITFKVTGYEDGSPEESTEGADTQIFSIEKIKSQGIYGTWVSVENAPHYKMLSFSFLEDGRYVHFEAPTDVSEPGGMEVGRFNWDEQTKALTIPQIDYDLNGDIGLTDLAANGDTILVDVDGDLLTLTFTENGETGEILFRRH